MQPFCVFATINTSFHCNQCIKITARNRVYGAIYKAVVRREVLSLHTLSDHSGLLHNTTGSGILDGVARLQTIHTRRSKTEADHCAQCLGSKTFSPVIPAQDITHFCKKMKLVHVHKSDRAD